MHQSRRVRAGSRQSSHRDAGRGPLVWLLLPLAAGPLPTPPATAQEVERVPDAAVIDGVPQGMFVGRSLLSGKAVCLLFLSGGRITRAIPAGGLERLNWAAHRAAHERDSGTWEIRGGELRITWGDGGAHRGPLEETETGIGFAGKRYWRPVTVELSELAGQWESARGTAIAGGQGVNALGTLTIGEDGTFRWTGTVGGVVAGRAAATERALAGTLSVAGATLTLEDAAGTRTQRTILVSPGRPIAAFTLDGETFTRVR